MNKYWLRSLQMSLAVVCVFAISGVSTVTAHQRGDVWTELGEDFTGESSNTETGTIVGDTYVLPASGTEVVIAEGVTADDPAESDFEDQVIVSIPQGIGAIAVIPGLGSPQTVMETYADAFSETLDGAEVIDIQSDRQQASGIYLVDLLGISVIMYITVDTSTMPGYLTIQVAVAEANIAEAITLLRENVTVDGVPMFAGVDEQSVQDLADDYTGQ